MFKKLGGILPALCLILCLALGCASAETVRGDLSQRFADVKKLEYEGEEYRLRDRITSVLAMGIGVDEGGVQRADFAMILCVDDNEKRITVVEIPANTLVQLPDEGGNLQYMRFADVYMMGEDPHENCLRLVDCANRVLAEAQIDHYLAFDVRGMDLVERGVQGTTKEKLKLLKARLEGMSSDEMNDLYADLGDYIITDMKSGALMKVADKAERYEVPPHADLPGTAADGGAAGEVLVPDESAIAALVVEAFYELNTW